MVWRGAAVGRLTDLLELSVLRRWSLSGAGGVMPGGPAFGAARPGRLPIPPGGAGADVSEVPDIPRPLHADWAWRPGLWAAPAETADRLGPTSGTHLGQSIKLFHDCPLSDCRIRQTRGPDADVGRFGLEIGVGRFKGSFVSLAIDLPPDAVRGLSQRHILGFAVAGRTGRALDVYARVNVRHGPNLAQVVRAWKGEARVDLDLAVTDLDEDRVAGAWVDLIFETPEECRIVLDDVTLSRRPRADL